jgi:hypothetical protein
MRNYFNSYFIFLEVISNIIINNLQNYKYPLNRHVRSLCINYVLIYYLW